MRILMPTAARSEIKRAFLSLRIGQIFAGVRGEEPIDLDALCDLVQGAARCIMDPDGHVESLDINRVMALDQGQGCVAVSIASWCLAG